MADVSPETKARLHKQLVKLGEMMGDGLHLEPDGKWIAKDYKKILKALGLVKPTKRNTQAINARMAQRVKEVVCQKCSFTLEQTRSGSKRAIFLACGAKYQLLK